ncbi:MAG: MvdC/MvdD family ATP grasp protein, partial [Blastocatellia bacterium]
AVNPFDVPHRPVTIPPAVATALRNLVTHFNLVFGAIDLIVTPADEYVFLENNPNGQWYWIELITGLPMAATMAKLLASPKGE